MLLLISVFFQAAWSQNFVEITTNGWGLGEAGSKAVFVDLDNNGRLDMLLAGSYAPIAHYEQESIGSLNFELVNSDFLGITTDYYCALCVTEFNGNNRLDLIIDDGNRTQAYYEQINENSREFALVRDNLTGIYIGSSLSPCVADIDGDGLYDLLFGEFEGNLN